MWKGVERKRSKYLFKALAKGIRQAECVVTPALHRLSHKLQPSLGYITRPGVSHRVRHCFKTSKQSNDKRRKVPSAILSDTFDYGDPPSEELNDILIVEEGQGKLKVLA